MTVLASPVRSTICAGVLCTGGVLDSSVVMVETFDSATAPFTEGAGAFSLTSSSRDGVTCSLLNCFSGFAVAAPGT